MKRLEHYKDECPKERKHSVVACELNCFNCPNNKGWFDEYKRGKITRFTQCSFYENREEKRNGKETKRSDTNTFSMRVRK